MKIKLFTFIAFLFVFLLSSLFQQVFAFDSNTVGGLVSWIKADSESLTDGESVLTLHDRSNVAHNYSGNGATYLLNYMNGKAAFSFNGNGGYLNSGFSLNGTDTFIVGDNSGSPQNSGIFSCQSIANVTNDYQTGGYLGWTTGSIGSGMIDVAYNGTCQDNDCVLSNVLHPVNIPGLMEYQVESSTKNASIAWNNDIVKATTYVNPIQPLNMNQCVIGARLAPNLRLPFTGHILEILTFNHSLNSSDRNIVVTYLENKYAINLPTSSPISLPVPSLKQTSSPWNTDIYDSANEWIPPTTYQTISDWGCALTSAVMVLQYHGITTMPHDPSHTPLDPRSLNNWLKSQPDGYALDPQGNKTGNVNWLAVSRLTRLAGLNPSDNPDFHYHALMYKPVHSANTALLTTDLSNNIPDILEEPGHFVVATGTQNGTYTINDPYYNNRPTLNDGYNNTFSSLGRFIPSLTDLSYIFLVAPTNVTVSIKDGQNNQISDSFIQQPLENDTNPGQFNGSPIQEVYAATPSAGIYHVDVSGSSSTPFTIQAYLYDINGNVKLATLSGNITPPAHSDFVINFNKQDVRQSVVQTITFDTTINDVKYYQNNNEVAFGIGQALIALLQSAQKDTAKGNTTVAKIKLDVTSSLLNILNTFRNKGISETAYQTLFTDINSLKTQL